MDFTEHIPAAEKNMFTAKWLNILFWLYVLQLVVFSSVIFIRQVILISWLNIILQIFLITVLFRLSSVNIRYRKAAIFLCFALCGEMISMVSTANALGSLFSICSLIALYQEYAAHSELCTEQAPALAGKWISLFHWKLGIGLAGSLFTVFAVVLAVMSNISEDTIITAAVLLITLIKAVIEIICLLHLKKTIAAFAG